MLIAQATAFLAKVKIASEKSFLGKSLSFDLTLTFSEV
jgi:hypothetical protein